MLPCNPTSFYQFVHPCGDFIAAVSIMNRSITRTQLEPHPCHMADTPSPSPPGLEDIETLALQVFARVWKEFNVADTKFCEVTIGSLATSSVAEDKTLFIKPERIAASPGDIESRVLSVVTSTSCPSKPHVPHVCDETGIPTLALPPAVEPYPEYESWTPTNRSIFRGDDSDDMRFLPFADESAFDKQAYGSFFKTLAWQDNKQMDADCELPLVLSPLRPLNFGWVAVELIVLEATHRLYFDHGIELERIDDANVLPFTLLGDSGFIHKASQR